MFAVIYRGYLQPGKEEDYLDAWKVVAQYFVEKRGAIGSTLHRAEGGLWVAYSRWPDKKTRDTSWPKDGTAVSEELPPKVRKAILVLKDCLDPKRALPEICLDVVDEV